MSFDPDKLNLIRGLRPFLSPSGQKATNLIEHLGDLLNSESGQLVQQSFSNLRAVTQTLPMEALSMKTNPFTLFLILILLLLSDGMLNSPNSGGGANPPNTPPGQTSLPSQLQ